MLIGKWSSLKSFCKTRHRPDLQASFLELLVCHGTVQAQGFLINKELGDPTFPCKGKWDCHMSLPILLCRTQERFKYKWRLTLLCYLCVTFIFGSVMSPVFFPSMVHHTSVRDSFRKVKKTSQDRTRSSPGKKGKWCDIAKQEQHQADFCGFQWSYHPELCLPL